ncbi:hypothetical protein MOQ_009730 [Trypanosoma cruzi marinkellei]|uniref:Uncharacterized protein n=1 Tax=Trypanosoma cruzi marinkellei TaxID=85056 RepID=K2MLL3_TRYCR|nr:hypothetical protein MOQ_009730 [Trypanosoma cruzi marinkellei]
MFADASSSDSDSEAPPPVIKARTAPSRMLLKHGSSSSSSSSLSSVGETRKAVPPPRVVIGKARISMPPKRALPLAALRKAEVNFLESDSSVSDHITPAPNNAVQPTGDCTSKTISGDVMLEREKEAFVSPDEKNGQPITVAFSSSASVPASHPPSSTTEQNKPSVVEQASMKAIASPPRRVCTNLSTSSSEIEGPSTGKMPPSLPTNSGVRKVPPPPPPSKKTEVEGATRLYSSDSDVGGAAYAPPRVVRKLTAKWASNRRRVYSSDSDI